MDQTALNERLNDIKAVFEEIEDDVDVLAYCLSLVSERTTELDQNQQLMKQYAALQFLGTGPDHNHCSE
jgi:hypothetical protein